MGWPAALALGAALFFACEEGDAPPATASTGGGEGGCLKMGPPEALYTLRIRAMSGPVPSDTRLQVRWSAGEEPEFVLDDPSTYRTLEDGSNVVCAVSADGGAPTDLDELSCELWTSGATEIEVRAEGYLTHTETVTPKMLDDCEQPLPSEVVVELKADLDSGMGSGS